MIQIKNKAGEVIYTYNGANLKGADLSGAKKIYVFGPIESGRLLYAILHEKDVFVKCGCFWGSLAELMCYKKADSQGKFLYSNILQLLNKLEDEKFKK